AEDLLIQAFPQVLACPETLPSGDVPIPWEHPIVRQTIEDCLHEAMDFDGFLEMLQRLRSGEIRRVAVDTAEPSAFARGILNAAPYAFLDDAPLEERRTQAVISRRYLDPESADTLGALDPDAVARVREEAWPDPRDAEEVHEALGWMGYVSDTEAQASGWSEWLDDLRSAGRVTLPSEIWRAVEFVDDAKAALRGRLEALGPIFRSGDREIVPLGDEAWTDIPQLPRSAEPLLLALENEGVVLRCRLAGRDAWCERRLLARVRRDTLDRLRKEIEPVSAAEFWRFLAAWQHVDESRHLEGPSGVLDVVRQLAGFEIPASRWESSVLPMRVRGYRPEWLDELTLTGEVAWGRLWSAGDSPIRTTPVCLFPREQMESWLAWTTPPDTASLSTYAQAVLTA